MNNNKQMKVFVSYGHDEYKAFASQLVEYLREKGFDVWFDERDIHDASYWDEEIERGLLNVSAAGDKGKFILVMTPKSVGRPEGFCLNEIAMALDKKISIIPLMLKPLTPPILIYRIQYIDCQNCMTGDVLNEDFCKDIFKRVEENIHEYSLNTMGSHSALKSILSPIDFSSDINHFQCSFVGRSWLDDIVNDWLTKRTEKCLFIQGKPGSGKTAISTHLLSVVPNIVAYHICRRNNLEKSNPRKAVCTIAYQIATQIPEYSEKILSILTEKKTDTWNSETLFEELIVNPLSSIKNPDDRSKVILVDALDESSVSGGENLVTFLSYSIPRLPEWIRIIVTSRPLADIVAQFSTSTLWLDINKNENSTSNQIDMLSYIDKVLMEYSTEVCYERAKEQIVQNADGVFLYVKTICDSILSHEMNIDNYNLFPTSISSIYYNFFAHRFPDIKGYNIAPRALLSLMVSSFDPLTKDMICRLMGIRKHELESILMDFGGYVAVRPNNELQFFHLTLMEWLAEDKVSGKFSIDRAEGDEIFCRYNIYDKVLSPYLIRHLPKHLALTGKGMELLELFNDESYLDMLESSVPNKYEVVDILFENFSYYYDAFCAFYGGSSLKSFYLSSTVLAVFRKYSFFLFDKGYYKKFKEMKFEEFISKSDFKSLPEILRIRTLSYYYSFGRIDDVLNLDFSDIKQEDFDILPEKRKKDLAGFYNMLGVSNRIFGNLPVAEEYILRSANYYRNSGNLDSAHIVAANVSRVYKYNLNFAEAERILTEGMEYALSFGFPTTYNDEYERILHIHNGPTSILAEYAIDVYNIELAERCLGILSRFFENEEARRGSRFYPRYLLTMAYLSLMKGDINSSIEYSEQAHQVTPSYEMYYQVNSAIMWYKYFSEEGQDPKILNEALVNCLKSMNGAIQGKRWEIYAYIYPLYSMCCEILGVKPEYAGEFPYSVFEKWIEYRKNFYRKLVEHC